jgi:hypothetical protein
LVTTHNELDDVNFLALVANLVVAVAVPVCSPDK